MLAYFFRDGIQINLVIALAKKAMRSQLFHSRPFRHVADHLVQLANAVSVTLNKSIDELACVALGGKALVVMILAIIFSRPVELDDVLHQSLLTNGGRSVVNTLGHLLNSLTSTHILYQICCRTLWRIPHVPAGDNNFRHNQSPPFCHSSASSKVRMPFTFAIS